MARECINSRSTAPSPFESALFGRVSSSSFSFFHFVVFSSSCCRPKSRLDVVDRC